MIASSGFTYVSHPNHRSPLNSSFADHEPGLWRAVITQALMDASTDSRKPEARKVRADALAWLLTPSEDFDDVCDNAGMDPDYVRSRAVLALQRGCQWRLPAGQGWRTRARVTAPAMAQ
jgi:hypothetical protein